MVEDSANLRLGRLTERLGLSEEQQDRIFPVLASAAPGFHPIMQPERGNPGVKTPASGEAIYGDGGSIKPGAPIAEIENAIYPELDELQQASLEEEAMDREEWWEDVVAMLEADLKNSTDPSLIGGAPAPVTDPTPASGVSEEERAAAGATNEVDDFSNLLFGN